MYMDGWMIGLFFVSLIGYSFDGLVVCQLMTFYQQEESFGIFLQDLNGFLCGL